MFQWNPGTRFPPGIWKLHSTCEHAATRSAYLINLSLNEEEAREKRSWSGNRLLVNCLITSEPLKCGSVYKNGCNSSAFNAMLLLNLLNYSWRSGLTSGLFDFKSIAHRAKSFSNQKLKDLTVNILFLKVSTGFKLIVCQINTEKSMFSIRKFSFWAQIQACVKLICQIYPSWLILRSSQHLVCHISIQRVPSLTASE